MQDSPLYGAERRGAPVVAFTRFADGPIYERGYIEHPDLAVLMDCSLLAHPEAAVLDGLTDTSVLLVNSARRADELQQQYPTQARLIALDLTAIVLDVLGHNLLSAPMAAVTLKVADLAPWPQLAEAVRIELTAIGLHSEQIARNLEATQRAYEAAPVVGLREPREPKAGKLRRPFTVPRLPARIAAPVIEAEATSLLRTTAGWRLYRPVLQRSRCTRCFMCFALCPEGAVQLDAENYPLIDYAHCKGCLVCMTECAPRAIDELREDAA